MKTYEVRFDGEERKAILIDELGCGFAFVDDRGGLESTVTGREHEILERLNNNLDECISEGWVNEE